MGSVLEDENNTEVERLLQKEDDDSTVKEYEESLDDFLKFNKEQNKEKEQDTPTTEESKTQKVLKRKRKQEDDTPLNILTDMFLRIQYPISRCMTKSIAVGLLKELGYTPNVVLNHGAKRIIFSEQAWDSFMKHQHLIECYLEQNMFGKKSAIRLLESDIEIDILKHRGQYQIRFRDLTKHDSKLQLSEEEFYILCCAASPISTYMKQLVFSSSVVKDYLIAAMEQHPDAQILYGPIDTSIFNRIPCEVEMWRRINEYHLSKETKSEKEEENNEVETILTE